MSLQTFTPVPAAPAPPSRSAVQSWSASEQLARLHGYYEQLLAYAHSLLDLATQSPHGELDRQTLASAAWRSAANLQRQIASADLEVMLTLLELAPQAESLIDQALELLRGPASRIELFLDPRLMEVVIDEPTIARQPNCIAHLVNRFGPSLRLGGLEAAHILASARIYGWKGAESISFAALSDGRIRMSLSERQTISEAEALDLAEAIKRVFARIETPAHPFAQNHLRLARFAAKGAFVLYLC